FSSRRRHTRSKRDWSSDVCSSDLVYRGGKIHFQAFERGKAMTKLEVRGKTDKHGTKVYFKPDATIFAVTTFDAGTITSRLRELEIGRASGRERGEEGKESD